MKKGYLGIGAAVFAFLIWACGDGSIEPVTDDELLMVGKWDPDIVDIQEACDACLADPECKKEYDKFAKKHGCVPTVKPNGETGWDEDGDGEIDNWGDDSGLPNFKLSSSAKADDEDGDDEGVSSDSEKDELSSASRHSSSSAPVYSAASVSSEDDEDDPVVREKSSSSKASGTTSSSSAIAYSAASAASGDDEDDPNLPPESRSSSSKAGGKSSSSSAIAYSATTYSSSDEEENPNNPPVNRSSSSSKPKSSSSSSTPVYVVSSSSSIPSGGSSSSRAARSSSAGTIIETSSVSQSSSSAKSSSSIAPRSSSSKAKSSSSQATGGSSGSQGGVTCGSQLTGTCTASKKTIVAGDPVTYTYNPSEADLACDGDIVWYTYDEGAAGGDVHYGGNTLATTYTKSGEKKQVQFEKGGRRISCDPVTVTPASPANCSCTPTRTSSGTNDLFDQSPVTYKWSVSGCTVAGAAANDLTYSWSGGNTSGSGTSATASYTSAGTYTPTVRVTTSEGMSTNFTCSSAEVKNTPPQNCSCTSTRTSTTDDLNDQSPVTYSLSVSGCTGSNLRYSWSGTGVSGSSTAGTGTASYTSGSGTFTPKVTVTTPTNASASVNCPNVTVKNTPPQGCSCAAELTSATNDLYKNSPVTYKWTVSGCSGSNLSYVWSSGVTGSGYTATGSYEYVGNYEPTVSVKTPTGGSATVTCEKGKVVNYAPPTCSVEDISHVYIGSAVSVLPSSLAGCDYDSDGCNYAITGGTTGGTGDSGYKGGKITGLIGEPNAGDIGSYTLTLENKIGTGYCTFDVAYTGADHEITSKGGSISVSNGAIVKISEDVTSGGLRCWHGWQSSDCTVNIESSSTVTKSIGSCNSGDGWGYIELPLSSLNSDRVAVITFTGVGDGAMICGVR